ncbi:MAG: hypothetical protein WA139_02620 [Candidatus Aenigmatarchaeota archaeon]
MPKRFEGWESYSIKEHILKPTDSLSTSEDDKNWIKELLGVDELHTLLNVENSKIEGVRINVKVPPEYFPSDFLEGKCEDVIDVVVGEEYLIRVPYRTEVFKNVARDRNILSLYVPKGGFKLNIQKE